MRHPVQRLVLRSLILGGGGDVEGISEEGSKLFNRDTSISIGVDSSDNAKQLGLSQS